MSIKPRSLLWLLAVLVWANCLAAAQQQTLAFSEYSRASNASLLWAPYRSNLYFGVRPRGISQSLLTGLMWYNGDTFQGLQDIRHTCEVGDDMSGFGWTSYDPRLGGTQTIRDNKNQVDITTEFVKTEEGNWAVRIKGVPRNKDVSTVLVFYAALEGEGSLDLSDDTELTRLGIDGPVKLIGKSPELGAFDIEVTKGPKSNKHPVAKGNVIEKLRPAHLTHYASLEVPEESAWQAKEIFVTIAQDTVQKLAQVVGDTEDMPPANLYFLPDNNEHMKGRMHFVQKAFKGSFEFDVLYNTVGTSKITTQNIESLSDDINNSVDRKFKSAFDFRPPFNTREYEVFAKELYSNLVGGMGYFHGKQVVDRGDYDEEDDEEFWQTEVVPRVVEEGPYDLLTLVPSRSFFPRGFYWDEGFHLIPVLEYDLDLVLEIMKSWLNLVDEDGWIAREQILGLEARSKVPQEFQTQYPHHANPPTLMLLLSRIVKKVHAAELIPKHSEGLGSMHVENPELLLSYIKQIYPNLQAHYEWFKTSQSGQIVEYDREAFSKKEGYRWRGRTPNHCLASGLDDYPRAPKPSLGELHVDLISWVGMFTRAMKDFAEVLGEVDDVEKYAKIENAIERNIEDLHWSENENAYCDASIDEFEEDVFVCHKGYVSLFPFLNKLIQEDLIEDRVPHILDLLSDPEQLWSDYGIRSLSKSSNYFGADENYWRGPIWVNVNYMVLDALQHYATKSETIRKQAAPIYKALRKNVVSNVYNQWKETGFAWEQYDSETGAAKGVKHFLGWTALVVNIMSMPESI